MDIPLSTGVGASYAHAWKQLKRHAVRLSLISLIPYLLQGGCSVGSQLAQGTAGAESVASENAAVGLGDWDLHGLVSLTPLDASVSLMDTTLERASAGLTNAGSGGLPLPSLWTLLVFAPLTYALAYVCVLTARGETPSLQAMFYRSSSVWSASIAASIVVAFLLFIAELPAIVADLVVMRPHLAAEGVSGEDLIWLVMPALFSIPCVVVGLRLSLTPFLVVDEELGALDAIKASWQRTAGHLRTLAGLSLLGIPILLLGLLCLIVGIIPAAVWIELAFASFYVALTQERKAGARTPLEGACSTTKPLRG